MSTPRGQGIDTASDLDALSANPTVLRILLGTQLRRLREAAGITREDAGDAIRASHAKISRLELGRVGFKERDVVDLLTLYGVTDGAERAGVLALARRANAPAGGTATATCCPSWFETYLRARAGGDGHPHLRAAVRARPAADPGLRPRGHRARPRRPAEEVERRVELRMRRQEMLHQPEAPHLWAVIDEAALRRAFGARR